MKRLFQFLKSNHALTGILALAWTVLIFIGCSMPGKELPKLTLFDQFDKVVHFSFFLVFYILWNSWKEKPWLIILLAAIYGFAIEYYQLHCVAGRSFDVWDGVADTFGALCGFGLMMFWGKKTPV
ncbi:MAG: VanZ family protein [Chitinophagaceae bacterium]|nr:VanZ family protein [Chitinophagaceae bacterium]